MLFNKVKVIGIAATARPIRIKPTTTGRRNRLPFGAIAAGALDSRAYTLAINAPATDFSVGVSPSIRTITRGASTTYSLTVQSLNGFSSSVSLFAINLPPGFVPTGTSWSPATVTPPAGGTATSTLMIGTNSATAIGTFTITLRAVSGALTREVPVIMTLN